MCVDPETDLPYANNLSNLSNYFVRKAALEGLAAAREALWTGVTVEVRVRFHLTRCVH